jgi:hypothetical protein
MPVCEGLPDRSCPNNKNDNSVQIGKGDLLLCQSCDTERRRLFDEDKRNKIAGQSAGITRASGAAGLSTATSHASPAAVQTTSSANTTTAAASVVNIVDTLLTTNMRVNVNKNIQIVINELLTYVAHYRNQSNVGGMLKIISTFYHPTEISEAKRILIGEYASELTDCPLKVGRRHSPARSASDAEAEDIVGIFDFIDNKGALDSVQFAAVKLDRIPKYGPEEINVFAIADKQQQLDVSVCEIAADVRRIDVNNELLKSMTIQLQAQLDKCTVACSHVTDLIAKTSSTVAATAARSSNSQPVQTVDRSRNIVVNGIDENRDSTIWRNIVSRALSIAVGREVSITDAFRLGHFVQGKKRPILVKLNSAWDRRLVLDGARALASTTDLKRVYLSADEPLEVRRKNTFDNLKSRNRGPFVRIKVLLLIMIP